MQYSYGGVGEIPRFNVIQFASDSSNLFTQSLPLSEDSKQTAFAWIDKLEALGGTNMQEPLASVISKSCTVFLFTDGDISDTEKVLETVEASRHPQSRLFTLGIGYSPNHYFMRKLAEKGRGLYAPILAPSKRAISEEQRDQERKQRISRYVETT